MWSRTTPHAACGENSRVRSQTGNTTRTIPTRVGRTPTSGSPTEAARRTIPTCRVGKKTKPAALGGGLATDHPHARGENGRDVGSCVGHVGPSPTRVGRSLCVGPGSAEAVSGRIPDARGGRTARTRKRSNISVRTIPARAWGERSLAASATPNSRTIPTHVGRTIVVSSLHRPSRADRISPRAWGGGENENPDPPRRVSPGPSPRAWGEPRFKLEVSRVSYGPSPRSTRVGRTPRKARAANEIGGPSPRAWGELMSTALVRPASRTIPTSAWGELPLGECPLGDGRTIPRAWGERSIRVALNLAGGPSPRASGRTIVVFAASPWSRRTIPTRGENAYAIISTLECVFGRIFAGFVGRRWWTFFPLLCDLIQRGR